MAAKGLESPKVIDPNVWYTKEGLANALGLSVQTIQRYRREWPIRFEEVGSKVLILGSEFMAQAQAFNKRISGQNKSDA